ncbi:SDR family oxidoreductase [Streptomyces sp. NPDC001817]|uniref:SDR family NAD(P)-dependent oxidoreductase n=1 Tax=Streptomyces sp. NPDC001817 TaxID=3154398 RepID=UPI003326962D
MPTIDLTGKAAVVTGSGRGLGLAYAQALAAHGASVVVNDIDEAVAEQAVKSITEAGGTAVAEVVPVGTAEAADRLVNRAVEAFGRLDVLVTNAGILRDKVLWKMTDDDFDAVITTHLRGTFTCARAAAVRMREQGEGGTLVLVGSPAGQRGNFGQTNYAAAKAGIAAMARTWSMELARANITVNAIVPVAATAMTETIPAFAPYVEAMRHGQPLPAFLRKGEGFGTPEDCAALVPFLASEPARGITGQCIGIGGDKVALWSHPQEIRAAYADGGWTPDALADAWPTSVGAEQQTVGIPAPKIPEA